MAYCAVSDITDEFKGLVISNSGTAITTAQCTEWIEQESNYIDAKIGLRYVAPVAVGSYPIAYSILKRICIFRVSERVKNKIEVKANASQTDTEQKYIENYIRTPNYDLDQIVKGNLILKDVPLVNSDGGVASPCGVACDTSECHTFDVNTQQW